jgi:hypothetical protein
VRLVLGRISNQEGHELEKRPNDNHVEAPAHSANHLQHIALQRLPEYGQVNEPLEEIASGTELRKGR